MSLKEIISNDFKDLFEKNDSNTLKNEDFTRVWTDVVTMPMLRFEEVIRKSQHTFKGYDLDQAVIYGLIMRIYKFLAYSRRITCKRLNVRTTAAIISRNIMESNVNLRYLIKYPNKLDDYRKSSLKSEKEFEELIQNNRSKGTKEENDSFAEYEDGLLKYISEAYLSADMSQGKKIPKLEDMRKKMNNVGLSNLYASYSTDSHSVHGDWIDTEKNFLKKENGRYYPNFDDYEVDIRQLNPILEVCYESLIYFLDNYPGHGITDVTVENLKEEIQIIMDFDHWHHNFLNGRSLIDKKF